MDGVTLITGSTSGIGKAIYENLSTDSICLCIDRNQNRLEKLTNNSDNQYFICDLRFDENIVSLFNYCNASNIKIRSLIHCAGLSPISDYAEMTQKEMDETFQVNVFAFAKLCQCLFDYPQKCEPAHVIAISSIAADRASGRQAIYASSKSALNSFVLAAAQEGIKYGIRVNALSLGAVDTPMLNRMKTSESFMSNIERHYPLGVMKPKTVAEIVRAMLSDRFNNMTGSILKVDSGFSVVH